MASGTLHGDVRELVALAVLAPSSHNTQPWLFRVGDDVVALFADRTRALAVNDPDDRELTISCGAALGTLCIAARAAGREPSVLVLPDPDDPDLLALVRLGPPSPPRVDERALADAIPYRRTYRRRFAPRPVPPEDVAALVAAAAAEGAWLSVIDDDDRRHRLAGLVSQGDRAQWDDRRWRRELAAWMHPRRRGDGLAVPWLAAPMARAVVSTFDMGGGAGARDRDIAEGSPLIAVLGTDGDGPREWLAAGRALARVLLAAAARGLQASYLNQPCQVEALRPRLAELAGHPGDPQAVLRIGTPDGDLPPAARRPLDDVLMAA